MGPCEFNPHALRRPKLYVSECNRANNDKLFHSHGPDWEVTLLFEYVTLAHSLQTDNVISQQDVIFSMCSK